MLRTWISLIDSFSLPSGEDLYVDIAHIDSTSEQRGKRDIKHNKLESKYIAYTELCGNILDWSWAARLMTL